MDRNGLTRKFLRGGVGKRPPRWIIMHPHRVVLDLFGSVWPERREGQISKGGSLRFRFAFDSPRFASLRLVSFSLRFRFASLRLVSFSFRFASFSFRRKEGRREGRRRREEGGRRAKLNQRGPKRSWEDAL